jgi:hypothetical protein
MKADILAATALPVLVPATQAFTAAQASRGAGHLDSNDEGGRDR